jgi:hypothetical protein
VSDPAAMRGWGREEWGREEWGIGNRTSWSTLADAKNGVPVLSWLGQAPIGKAVLARPSTMANSNKTILATNSRFNYKKRQLTNGNCEEFGMNRQTLIQKLKEDIAQGRIVIIAGTGVSIAACGNQLIESSGRELARFVAKRARILPVSRRARQ